MTAFQRIMISFLLVIGLVYFVRLPKPDMTLVYPDHCVFVIDHLFSKSMQFDIKDFIDAAYKKSKHPSNILPKIESKFPAIKSVIIDMQNPELLHFSIQSHHPLFLINHEHVICDANRMFATSMFNPEELVKLHNIEFQGVPTPKNIQRMTHFFELLQTVSHTTGHDTTSILNDFSIRWIDKHAIWLDQKDGKDLSVLVGHDTIPTVSDIAQCRKLRGQILDTPCKNKQAISCKKNTTWVCDMRFNQQIVLFSTNRGV